MYGYSVPYETAKKLFTDYVVPTEAPTEAPDEAAN
jgi:hypothetical protein